MVETKLIRPAMRAVDARCPDCRHVRRIYSNAHTGLVHCMYCGADFEWTENAGEDDIVLRVRADWVPRLVGAPALPNNA